MSYAACDQASALSPRAACASQNADWTNQAIENSRWRLFKRAQGKLGNEAVVLYDEGVSGEGALTSQYANLFGAVSNSVIEYQFFPETGCPRKKRSEGDLIGVMAPAFPS